MKTLGGNRPLTRGFFRVQRRTLCTMLMGGWGSLLDDTAGFVCDLEALDVWGGERKSFFPPLLCGFFLLLSMLASVDTKEKMCYLLVVLVRFSAVLEVCFGNGT